jgi:hypothetical protein
LQRLLEPPGYDAATLAEKTGKSESLIYYRLALLHLIPDVAEAPLVRNLSSNQEGSQTCL